MPMFTSKADAAYAEIRRQILDGTLVPGAAVNQYELAESMGISITPLREAVRRLTGEGWLTQGPHHNARVARLDLTQARELLEARRALEPAAVALAAERRTQEDIELIQRAEEELLPVTRDQGEPALSAHAAFHRALYSCCHNAVLTRMLDDLWEKTDRYRRLGLELPEGSGPRDRDAADHHRLAQLVKDGDGEAAAALMTTHIERSLTATALQQDEDGSTAS